MNTPMRCTWALSNPLETAYHDTEWGVPQRDSRKLFELLVLEGAQAGLSWDTILAKRAGYRRAFDDFDPVRIARYDARRIERLMHDAGIVRNRLKIEATIGNARAYLALQERGTSLADYLWTYVDGRPLCHRRRSAADIPASTPLAQAMSKDLRRLGFRFVGPTIIYAFMQASGMVNDHVVDCFRFRELAGIGSRRTR